MNISQYVWTALIIKTQSNYIKLKIVKYIFSNVKHLKFSNKTKKKKLTITSMVKKLFKYIYILYNKIYSYIF